MTETPRNKVLLKKTHLLKDVLPRTYQSFTNATLTRLNS